MACDINGNIILGCNDVVGGVKNVYLSNNGTTWYTYEMDKGTASLVETYNVNQAASIIGYTQTLTMQLDKMEAAKQTQIALIAEANSMQVRVETNEGTQWLFGVERGAYMASGTTTSGTAYTDANQSEIVIQADSKSPMGVYVPPAPPAPGTLIVDYRQVTGTQIGSGGNSIPFPTKVVDLLETQAARPLDFNVDTGFNIGSGGTGTNYLVNTYGTLNTLWNMNVTLRSNVNWPTGNPALAWSDYLPGTIRNGNVFTNLPTQYYSGWPTTAPQLNDEFTLTITNYPVAIGTDVQTFLRMVILKNESINNDFFQNFSTVGGTGIQITMA